MSSPLSPTKTFILVLTSVLPLSAAPVNLPVARCADEIVRRQTTDGAILMNGVSDSSNRVVPYFANLAALGLVSAYQATGENRYLIAARHWSDWYEAHMNPDGTVCDYTGSPGAWRSSGGYDSTDSYAATWLELLDALACQDKAWAGARYDAADRAVSAIRLTLQPDGLTLAKPGWPVAYTMDNVETARGLGAAARVSTLSGHEEHAAAWTAMAVHMEAAIVSKLWDNQQMHYYVGIQTNGSRIATENKWYPDLMANLVAVGLGPPSHRHQMLYQELIGTRSATIPVKVRTEDDLEHLVWWGYAAASAGDASRLRKIQALLTAVGPRSLPIANTALLGHTCRLLTLKPAVVISPNSDSGLTSIDFDWSGGKCKSSASLSKTEPPDR